VRRTAFVVPAEQFIILAGCATAPPSTSTPAPAGESAPQGRPAKRANLNLSGFPVPYQEGYGAGCESKRDGGRHREEGRYKSDMNYKMGWDDGFAICGNRK